MHFRTLNLWLIILLMLLLGITCCEAHASDAQPPDLLRSSPTDAQPLTLDLPRLGMWWPDPWEQSLGDIARYDYVILWNDAAAFIPDLRARNPDILLLNATNACELSYNPNPGHVILRPLTLGAEGSEAWENEDVLKIPPAWFLTQVGSTLTEPVDNTQTVFHVAEITASDGTETHELFVPGDTALIEGESVLVENINSASRTLTVHRGYVRPASAHAAGTRIAAHITFWPESWMLNVSTLSPPAVISATIGPERWPDYNARVAARLVHSADWDGILLDRSDPDESWIIGNSTARTIDPDQSNTLLTDYSAFDAAWNEGLRRYEAALREAIGPDKIIFVNWGMPNYDLLNGNNFEGFPGDDGTAYGTPWRTTVFGPADGGGYFEWMAQAQQPNLTMIETYEDDGSPDPTSDGDYDNPCADPDFVPNYRKMRFGLTTALLHDGFFSYEINTNGHGSLCLLWFDEYDNAGAGRGYLGQPLSPAYQAGPMLTTPNLLGDSTFERDLAGWDLWADTASGYSATVTLDMTTAAQGSASARVDVTQSQGTDWRVEFSKVPVSVISGTEYTLSFWAKADADRVSRSAVIAAALQQNEDPWESYIWFDDIALTPAWHAYEITGIASGSDSAAVLHLEVGAATGAVWFDVVRLQTGSRQVWRRDYAGGTALLNATATTQTAPLGGIFRKIRGTQAPAVNDGSLVTQVMLPPLDGLIVLRIGPRIYLPVVLRQL